MKSMSAGASGAFVVVLLTAVEPSDASAAATKIRESLMPRRVDDQQPGDLDAAFHGSRKLWTDELLQGFYGESRKTGSFTDADNREKQTLRLLHFLAYDPVMATIKNKLDDIFSGTDGEKTNLAAVLGQAVYRTEGLLPWPLDRRCRTARASIVAA